MVQSLAFGLMGPATSHRQRPQRRRHRPLPLAADGPVAYLVGHVLAEIAAAMLGVAVMTAAGLLIGWRIHTDVPTSLAGFALLLLVAVR